MPLSEHRFSPAELSRLLGSWGESESAMPQSLAGCIMELVDSATIPDGAILPSQRSLAAALGVARGTVTTAYELLSAAEYTQPRAGSGSRVSRRQARSHSRPGEGRMYSFTDAQWATADLSSGALPALDLVQEALSGFSPEALQPYLATDGYFPAGIPEFRAGIARQLTNDGVPTTAEQILITAGAQQAVWLIANTLTGPGDSVLVEEPTYRGGLEAFAKAGAALTGIRFTEDGLDQNHLKLAMRKNPRLLYCQPAVHNPTGQMMGLRERESLAELINGAGQLTVEDCCSADLVLAGPAPARGLCGLVDPELLLTIGTGSKLFWGGLRIGWVRAEARIIARLADAKKAVDLSCSVIDQVIGLELLDHMKVARVQRLAMLNRTLETTRTVLEETFPQWAWTPPQGGSGLWVDTGRDAVQLAERAKKMGVKLAPGPAFSSYDGFQNHLRLPLWHPQGQLRDALGSLVGVAAG